MDDLISRQNVFNEILRASSHLDKDIIIRLYIELNMLPSVQPEREHTMEEFMYGQDMGNPEEGRL